MIQVVVLLLTLQNAVVERVVWTYTPSMYRSGFFCWRQGRDG